MSISENLPDSVCSLAFIESHPQKDAPTLLFIHGLESSKETWEPVIASLKDRYHIYAIDLRGHGESPRGDGDFSTKAMVQDVAAFVKQHKLDHFTLVAHSMGVRIALPYAAQNPDKIDAILMEDMELIPREAPKLDAVQVEKCRQFQKVQPSLEKAIKALAEHGIPRERVQKWVKKGKIKPVDGEWFIGFDPYARYCVRRAVLASRDVFDAYKRLAVTEIPVTLLIADNGSSVSKEGLEEMLSSLERLKAVKIEGSSHSIHETHTDLFIKYLNSLI